MDVRIGVVHTMKEIEVELSPDVDREEIKNLISTALSAEANTLWLTDRHGKDVAVPTSKIAYIELGTSDQSRRVGFGAA